MELRLRVDHHFHFNDSTNHKLDLILENMAKSKADFDQLAARLTAAQGGIADSLANLAEDVRNLTEGMTPTGGLTEAEATEVFSSLDNTATQMETIAAQIRTLADQTPDKPVDPPVEG